MTAPKPSNLVPKLRFPEFRDGPRWDLLTLSSASDVNPSNDGLPELFIYIDLESVKSGMLIERKEITRDAAPSRAQRLLSRKDIIYQTVRPYQRNNLLFDINDGYEYVASTGYAQLRAYECPEFLYQLFHTDSFVNSVEARCTGSNFPAINPSALASIHVALPRKPEQQKIADCLGSLDDLIAAEGRKLEALRQHKQGLMQQLFPQAGETVPRLRFPEFREAGEWEERLVGDVFKVTRGEVLAMPLVRDSRSNETPFPVYSSQTKNHGLAGYYSEYLYEDAITWTTDGANAGDVNYRTGKFYCTNVCGVLINNDGQANLCTAELINSVSRQHVSFVGNPKLMNGVMSKIAVPFPKPAEQQRIAPSLSSLEDVLAAQARKLNALKTHKQGLLQQLFPSLEGH